MPDGASAISSVGRLEQIFRDTFYPRWNTLLIGGAGEPLYLPADDDCPYHRLFYREDYFASALHETAHWCIAGEERRQLSDFGYWYEPDGRSASQQALFESVEVRPQALEWLFSNAAARPFRISADNLAAEGGPSSEFADSIRHQALAFCREGLPPRAHLFISALIPAFNGRDALDPALYRQLPS